jgi:hypothetical protein
MLATWMRVGSKANQPLEVLLAAAAVSAATGRFRAGYLFVFDDFDGLFLAPRAFKGALIVVWRIGGLDTDEPHLSATRFATREAHRPRLPNYLKGSHATRPRLLLFIVSTAQATAHLKNTYTKEESWRRRIF